MQSKFIFECVSVLCAIQIYFCMLEYFYVQSKFIFECPSIFTCTFLWDDCNHFPRRRKNIPESGLKLLSGMFCYQ